MAMNDMMRRIEVVYVATGGTDPSQRQDDPSLDGFRRAKRDLHDVLKNVRANIKERDELLEIQPNGTQTIEKSQNIRREIKSAREAASRMQDELTKDRKKKIKKLPEEELSKRGEQLELVWKHIEECERLEKRRYQPQQANPQQRGELFSVSGRGRLSATSPSRPVAQGSSDTLDDFHPATHSELPPIEVEEQLQQLRARDKQLDEGLEEIAQGVGRLKNVAQTIGDELEVQSAMIDEIENKVDNANEHLLNINRKMKKTLQKVGADRFMVNFILLMIVLGIATYIYSMMR